MHEGKASEPTEEKAYVSLRRGCTRCHGSLDVTKWRDGSMGGGVGGSVKCNERRSFPGGWSATAKPLMTQTLSCDLLNAEKYIRWTIWGCDDSEIFGLDHGAIMKCDRGSWKKATRR